MGRILFRNLLLAGIVFCSGFAHAIPIGFNQSWFKNDYARQFLDGVYDRQEVKRILDLNSLSGSRNLRLWFFESANFPMIEWKDGAIQGLRADYLRNVIDLLQLAREKNTKIYMTFLDGQAYRPDLLSADDLKRLRFIYQKKGSAEFLQKVIGPLLRAIEGAGLSSVVSRIDLSNEMDAVIKRFGFDGDWAGAGRMLCQWKQFIRSHPSFASTPVTFSIRLHPLVSLPQNLFDDQGPMACGDYLDFHSYDDYGSLYRCSDLRDYSNSAKKDLILGEFGQSYFNSRYDDELQKNLTSNYIRNAESCGFKEALTWRLSDVRPGFNKEARYSFESFGKVRPAFRVVQDHNLKQFPQP